MTFQNKQKKKKKKKNNDRIYLLTFIDLRVGEITLKNYEPFGEIPFPNKNQLQK